MAWTYNNWSSQSTTAARLASLRLHIDEVSAQIGKEISADGKAVSTNALQVYLTGLWGQRDKLEQRPDAGINGGVSLASFNQDSANQ